MKFIEKIKLFNSKRFDTFEYTARRNRNIFVGDNEVGKSTILQAIDIVLSGSRSRVETLGLETLFHRDAVANFLEGDKNLAGLPCLAVEIYLNDHGNEKLEGKNNTDERICHGLRLNCEPIDDYGEEIQAILAENDALFPYEFYSIKFSTFAAHAYTQNHRL